MNDVPQPSRKNWSLYAWVVGSGLVATAFITWIAVTGSPSRDTKTNEPAVRISMENMPERSFSPPPPPAPPPPPPAPPQPTPASLPSKPPKPAMSQKPPIVEKPKPMTTMFTTTEDSKAISEQQKTEKDDGNSKQQRISLDPKDSRPGSSEAAEWLNNAGNAGKDFVTSPYLPPMGPYVLQAGTIIEATLLNEVNSDLPGDVVAMVNQDVRDTATGQYVLIPATAKLYGRYSDKLRYGQSRALIAWNRLLFPDASSLNIGSMSGTDAGGAAGVEGDVDHHIGSMAAAIGVTAFLSVISQAGMIISGGSGTTNVGSIGADGAGREVQSIGREFVTRELDRPNTLSLKAGTPVAVMLSRDVITLVPYGTRQTNGVTTVNSE